MTFRTGDRVVLTLRSGTLRRGFDVTGTVTRSNRVVTTFTDESAAVWTVPSTTLRKDTT